MKRAVSLVALIVAVSACDKHPTAPAPPSFQVQMERVRAATAKYQDVAIALADGFVKPPNCASMAGQGAMGYHYTNASRVDNRVVAEEPEILVFMPQAGRETLVAVEYFVPVLVNGAPHFGPTAPVNPSPTPQLFGQTFDGPMAGHNASQPWHTELHAWIWRTNPSGMFASWNPDLACP